MVRTPSRLESRSSVLEKLLLPAIEYRRLEPRPSHRFEIGTPSTKCRSERLLFIPVCSASVASSSVRSVILTDHPFLHFQLRAGQNEGKGLHDFGTWGREGGNIYRTDVRRYDAESSVGGIRRLANSVTRHRGYLAAACRGSSARARRASSMS